MTKVKSKDSMTADDITSFIFKRLLDLAITDEISLVEDSNLDKELNKDDYENAA